MWNANKIWIHLRSSLWFIPSMMVVAAIILASGLIELDARLNPDLASDWPRLFGVNAEGARGILSAVASSTITVAGVVFSIVIVALTVASNQYTPRILRNFMRDRGTQSVLGVFVSVFTYSLIVMRTVRGGDEPFVPSLAIGGAILLSLVSIGFLVYFIHHIASSIQASTMTATITAETLKAIENLFPEIRDAAGSPDAAELDRLKSERWQTLEAQENGYLQHVGNDLLDLAVKHDLVIRVEKRIGEFVVAGMPLLSVCAAKPLDEKLGAKLRCCMAIDNFRTIEQDPEFGVRQLVDIALKALSPGVNDISTAITCVDYLGAILRVVVQRCPVPNFINRDGELRLIFQRPLLTEHLINEALLQIRQSGKNNPALLLRLLKVTGETASAAKEADLKKVLLKHVGLIEEIAAHSIESKQDKTAVLERAQAVRANCFRAEEKLSGVDE